MPRPTVNRHRPIAAVQVLEPRQLLATPSGPRPESLSVFDKNDRIVLINRMTQIPDQAGLKAKIGNGSTARIRDFDNSLLEYMRTRSNVNYFFAQDELASTAAFIAGELHIPRVTDPADQIVDARLFPNSPTQTVYSADLGNNINFRAPNGDLGNPFSLTINRFEYWGNLADAVWLTNDPGKYVDEITYQLAVWSGQFDSNIDAPGNWNDVGKSGWQLATSIRAESWAQTYMKMVSHDNQAWSAPDNTLMLTKLLQHGDWLYNAARSAKVEASIDSNKTIMLAKALYTLGRLFPEFDMAAQWEEKGRSLLIESMSAQVYADGSHREQSPGYAVIVADDLLDVYWLDKLNNDTSAWETGALDTLEKAIESYRQFLSPDGRRPGIGDTARTLNVGIFLKAGLILDRIQTTSTTLVGNTPSGATSLTLADASSFQTGDLIAVHDRSEILRVVGKSGNTLTVERGVIGTSAQSLGNGVAVHNLGDQPFAKPTIGDVWMLGVNRTTPFINAPATPEGLLGPRGKAYAMTDSGNYILRSDDSSRATQLIFDAGPKGGFHGHHDLLNFELWSGGRPLIIDPGGYDYSGGADRDYVVSTRAHNTVNVDGQNHGWIEGEKQPAILASHNFQSGYATLSGTHFAYSAMTGQPVITRNIWYNYGDTLLVVDWGESSTSHTFQQSFNVPGDGVANVTGPTGGTEFRTRYNDGSDNVRVKTINGGSLVKGGLTFVSSTDADGKDDAYRYTISKTGDFAVFVTLINVYTGLSVPNVDAELVTGNPQPGQPIQVRLLRNGTEEQTITFQQPAMTRPSANLNVNARVHDAEFDKNGNLHMVYQDSADGFLKYTVKSAATGKWSVSQIVDDSNNDIAASLDMALDGEGRPGVAYYDRPNGDLKYASMTTQNNAWRRQTVDSKGTVGQNASLTFTRKGNAPIITYYHRTKMDLRMAIAQTSDSWSISTIDGNGNVGRSSHVMLDPNRPDLNSRWVVVYEDSDNAQYKYAYTAGTLKFDTIKAPGVEQTGGFVSLAFEDTGSGTVGTATSNRFQPRFTFYENWPDASLWMATRDKNGGNWSVGRIDGTGTSKKLGAYNQLSYASGRAEVFYYDDKHNLHKRMVRDDKGKWAYYVLGEGGRETKINRLGSTWTVTGFDSKTGRLTTLTV